MLHDVNTLVHFTKASLSHKKNSRFLQTRLNFSHKRSTCVQQFAVSCSFLFVPLAILYFYHLLLYFSNITTTFLDSCCVQLTGIAFIVHFFSHVAAVTIDPADASVRAKQSYSTPMPLFDRTKQSHVIQDLHCYLCDVKVYVFKAVVFNVI